MVSPVELSFFNAVVTYERIQKTGNNARRLVLAHSYCTDFTSLELHRRGCVRQMTSPASRLFIAILAHVCEDAVHCAAHDAARDVYIQETKCRLSVSLMCLVRHGVINNDTR